LNVTGTILCTPLAAVSNMEAVYCPEASPSAFTETCISWNLPELSSCAGETVNHAAALRAITPSSCFDRGTVSDCGAGTAVPLCWINVSPFGKPRSVSVARLYRVLALVAKAVKPPTFSVTATIAGAD
jgi:hypothetical protein